MPECGCCKNFLFLHSVTIRSRMFCRLQNERLNIAPLKSEESRNFGSVDFGVGERFRVSARQPALRNEVWYSNPAFSAAATRSRQGAESAPKCADTDRRAVFGGQRHQPAARQSVLSDQGNCAGSQSVRLAPAFSPADRGAMCRQGRTQADSGRGQ